MNEYISNINSDKIFEKILLYKIILQFINNYEGIDHVEDKNRDILLIKYKDKFEKLLYANINIFMQLNNNLDLTFIKEKNIDEIIIQIITSLLTTRIEYYDYVYNILNELDFENINLTKEILDKLINIFDRNNNIIDSYIIKSKEDLFIEIKINFYYILLKYILKNPYFIYQFNFLLKTRKLILKLYKLNELPLNFINNNIKDKYEYVIKTLFDSEYYFSNISEKNLKLKEISCFYKNYYFESKKEDIKMFEDIIKYNKGGYKNYLNDYNLAEYKNKRYLIIKDIFYNNKKIDSENNLEKNFKIWETLEKSIKDRKMKIIHKKYLELLNKYFCDKNNKEYLLKIFKQEDIDYLINNQNKNSVSNNISEKKVKEIADSKNKNLLMKKKKIGNEQNSTSLAISNIKSKEIIEENDGKEEKIIKEIINKFCFSFKLNKNKGNNIINSRKFVYGNQNKEISWAKLKNLCHYNIKNTSLIDNLERILNFIKEFEERLKIEFINNFNFKMNLYFHKYITNNTYDITCIYELITPFNNNPLSFKESNIPINGIDSLSNGFKFLLIEMNHEKYKILKYRYFIKNWVKILMKPKPFVRKEINYSLNFMEQKFYQNIRRKHLAYFINSFDINVKFNNNSFIIIQNKLFQKSNEVIKRVGYAYRNCPYCFYIYPKNENSIKFLYACQKIFNNKKKDGILIIYKIERIKDAIEFFYETPFFESYCVCPFLLKENSQKYINNVFMNKVKKRTFNKDFYNNNSINNRSYTNETISNEIEQKFNFGHATYFLAGGFDITKKEAAIKLFIALFDEVLLTLEIFYIQDIKIQYHFQNPITSIEPSNYNSFIFFANKTIGFKIRISE